MMRYHTTGRSQDVFYKVALSRRTTRSWQQRHGVFRVATCTLFGYHAQLTPEPRFA